jgi:hypothetical protein
MAAAMAVLPMVVPTPLSSRIALAKLSAPFAPPKKERAEMPMIR